MGSYPSDNPDPSIYMTPQFMTLEAPMPSEKTISERLRNEAMRLSGHSLDYGSADAGIAANLADAAADALDAKDARAHIADAFDRQAEKLKAAEEENERWQKYYVDECDLSNRRRDALYAAESDLAATRARLEGVMEGLRNIVECQPDPDAGDRLGEMGIYQNLAAKCKSIARALLSAPADGWLDIESAPRDGTHLLLCIAGYVPLVGHWSATEGCWVSDPDDQAYRRPSHWRHLPASPSPPIQKDEQT